MATFAAAKALIGAATVKEVDPDDADSITPHGAVLLGTNAQTRADRARDLLQWQPQGHSLEAEIERAILEEAEIVSKSNEALKIQINLG